ncbi:MAG: hypothetical protein PHI35_07300, partial [Victivallaceae bacterium]|nr:hypothetical protein [Victivallaceae bacterium]
FEFTAGADFDEATPLKLAVETPEKFRFSLNGKPFKAIDRGKLFDQAFRLIDLPANTVKPGRNVIGMKLLFHQGKEVYDALERARQFETEYNKLTYDTELESIYLVGGFSVRHTGKIQKLDREAWRYCGVFELGAPISGMEVAPDDLPASGLPFFAGKLKLAREVTLTKREAETIGALRFRAVGVNSCLVRINGEVAGQCFWAPWAVQTGGLLKPGVNRIELELTLSLRNLLGPHHLVEGECYGVTTLSFNKDPNIIDWAPPPYAPGYCLVENGIADMEFI